MPNSPENTLILEIIGHQVTPCAIFFIIRSIYSLDPERSSPTLIQGVTWQKDSRLLHVEAVSEAKRYEVVERIEKSLHSLVRIAR